MPLPSRASQNVVKLLVPMLEFNLSYRERGIMDREKVLIFDTSLRDGEQAPGCSMNIEEKLLLARKLQRLGVDIIEAGFPVASPGDADAVRLVAGEVEGPIIA